MSFSLNYPCFNCKKKEDCKDAQHIQEGITAAHLDQDGHKGSGFVLVSCCKCEANN
jgi:hypothetical protein